MAWCLLTAILIAKKSGTINSDNQRHIFIVKWLQSAQRKKIFDKKIAGDIIWLIQEAKNRGFEAKLYDKINYIWICGSGLISNLDPKRRFESFLDSLQLLGWYRTIVDHDISEITKPLKTGAEFFYSSSEMKRKFDQSGCFISEMLVVFSGPVDGVLKVANDCSLKIKYSKIKNGMHYIYFYE